MNKNLIPDFSVGSIDELDGKFFANKGIKAVFLDIDNTLVAPKTPIPDKRADRFIDSLTEEGLRVCLVSNNNKRRVDAFNTHGLFSVHRAAKPFTFAYMRLLKKLGIGKEQAAAVGDQFFSDIYGANRAGLMTVYVLPIKPGGEGAFVWLKRLLEKPVIKKLKKENEIYGKNV